MKTFDSIVKCLHYSINVIKNIYDPIYSYIKYVEKYV